MEPADRSHEVNEIIGTPASWLMRNGTLLLGTLIGALVVLASFYQYPTTLRGELVLTTVDPPRQLTAKQGFDVQRLLVANGDTVEAGQTLLVARRGEARFEHVLYLEDQLLNQKSLEPKALLLLDIPPTLVLGDMQDAVYQFQEKQALYRNLAARQLDAYTSRELDAMIAREEREVRVLRDREERLKDEVINARVALAREQELSTNGVQFTERLTTAQQKLERAEEDLQRNTSKLRSTSFAIELMRNQIESYRSGQQGSTQQAGIDLREAFDALQSAVTRWKRDYTTVSPVAGKVILSPEVQEGNYLAEGKLLATVLPLNAGGTVGRMELDVRGSGRIEEGQRVVVDFPKWPALEYGSVTGEIASVGLVPVAGKLPVQVAFPEGLVTSTGHNITPDPFLQGEATVIVDQRRLLNRLLSVF
ncbi:HlyD family efflux transporter periplasmic adaptor subunit [Neolewinella litorea]|uniref:HlyD family efflux transporter periplasmic adaptor subunit n=1 Tax=Neolewinella litorea TaxID=2562452 RepID=A0A4S4NN45_9BACT|nr:HlyD family efflux transporter periplasmic adaptor subunit [Neolewinella litorea]THH41386.1 HlyD family efflux transporter periplasmic adaptor subunit [Neolewinella litorea]